jgi:hypothetical protein
MRAMKKITDIGIGETLVWRGFELTVNRKDCVDKYTNGQYENWAITGRILGGDDYAIVTFYAKRDDEYEIKEGR